jgi:hypothetical protein
MGSKGQKLFTILKMPTVGCKLALNLVYLFKRRRWAGSLTYILYPECFVRLFRVNLVSLFLIHTF